MTRSVDYYPLSTETVLDYVCARPELGQIFHDGEHI